MAATHPAYNLMKMPGSSGVLAVAGDTKEAVAALKLAFKATAAAFPADKAMPGPDQEEAAFHSRSCQDEADTSRRGRGL